MTDHGGLWIEAHHRYAPGRAMLAVGEKGRVLAAVNRSQLLDGRYVAVAQLGDQIVLVGDEKIVQPRIALFACNSSNLDRQESPPEGVAFVAS